MEKASSRKKATPATAEMRREYRFDYEKARPNRFASLVKGKTIAVVLDADVASVFQSSESVSALLRSVISALPRRARVNSSAAGDGARKPTSTDARRA